MFLTTRQSITQSTSSQSTKMADKTPARFEFRTPSRSTPRTPIRGRTTLASGATPGRSGRKTPGDRYIPTRATTDMQFARFKMSNRLKDENSPPDKTKNTEMLDKLLNLQGVSSSTPSLGFCSPQGRKHDNARHYWQQYTPQRPTKRVARARKVPKNADRVLDAPNLINDFYLNVLDWSSTGLLAVALRDTVYLLNTNTGSIEQLSIPSTDYVSSLTWSKSSKHLAVGTSSAQIQLWDVGESKVVRQFTSHNSRVSTLAWNPVKGLLSSGSQRGYLHHYDPRLAQYHVASSHAHRLDVCGLAWSPSGRLLASGGNDNMVQIWDMYQQDPWSRPAHTFKEHSAAVKALAWCPWQPSILASGGGSADKRVCVWNGSTGQLRSAVDTGSQVSGLLWSSHHKELLSAHGNPSNHLALWSCDSSSFELCKRGCMSGHDDRVLHVTKSPDGVTVVSAGADETLRFWKVFHGNKTVSPTDNLDPLSLTNFIR